MNYFRRFDFFRDCFSNARMRGLETVSTASIAVPNASAARLPSLYSGGFRGLLTTRRLFMPANLHTSLVDKKAPNVPFLGEEQPEAGDWYVTGMSHPLTYPRSSRREYLSRRCERQSQEGERVPVGAPPPSFFPAKVYSKRLEYHVLSPFVRYKKSLAAAISGRRLTRAVGPALAPFSIGCGRTYSAGNRFVPFLVQLISPRFVRFHRAVRRPPLSSGTVGNCSVNACSTSGAVNRSAGRDLMIARTVSVRLPEPVTRAVKALMEPLIACNKSLFFCARLVSSSISFWSASIKATRSDCRSTNFGWIVGVLMDLIDLPCSPRSCKAQI
jgi:hypothetical protein